MPNAKNEVLPKLRFLLQEVMFQDHDGVLQGQIQLLPQEAVDEDEAGVASGVE